MKGRVLGVYADLRWPNDRHITAVSFPNKSVPIHRPGKDGRNSWPGQNSNQGPSCTRVTRQPAILSLLYHVPPDVPKLTEGYHIRQKPLQSALLPVYRGWAMHFLSGEFEIVIGWPSEDLN